jgi:hypothetical protein
VLDLLIISSFHILTEGMCLVIVSSYPQIRREITVTEASSYCNVMILIVILFIEHWVELSSNQFLGHHLFKYYLLAGCRAYNLSYLTFSK